MAIAVHTMSIKIPERRGSIKVLTGRFLEDLRRGAVFFFIFWII